MVEGFFRALEQGCLAQLRKLEAFPMRVGPHLVAKRGADLADIPFAVL